MRPLRYCASLILAASFVVNVLSPLVAAEEDAEPQDSAAQWREIYLKEAKSLDLFTVVRGEKRALSFQPQPIMRWVSLNDFDGDVFVWLADGRPQVVGNIVGFSANGLTENQRYTLAELHSVSHLPVAVVPREDDRWETATGAMFKTIPGAPPPAETERGRKLQARAIARQFSGRMLHYEEKWQLRLLDKPLYEYGQTSEVLGGAIFAMVAFRTDPELLLMIEAREAGDGPEWTFLPVRFSQQDLWLEHNDTPVWESILKDSPELQPKAKESLYRVYDNKLHTLPPG